MSQELWTTVDQYLTDLLVPQDAALTRALLDSQAAGLPSIHVSPTMGKFLGMLARFGNAKRILEIGTLGGYSTIWLARGLPPGGRLLSLEAEPLHANIARKNIARAGLSDVVEVRLGLALETLPAVQGPFDLIFIDADKPSNADYFAWALKLSRVGTLIIVDNVVRKGKVIDAASQDENVLGVRRLNQAMAAEKRVSVTTLQTVGVKGYDGIAVALVLAIP